MSTKPASSGVGEPAREGLGVDDAAANKLHDIERAVDDGVNVIKALIKGTRLVPGTGTMELGGWMRMRVDLRGWRSMR